MGLNSYCRNSGRLGTIILYCIIFFIFKGNSTNPDTLATRLAYQVWSFPQEKVYIVTDKSSYYAGDTIRFRSFLIDATTLTQKCDGSKYVYVDVINPFGEKVESIKVIRNKGKFIGYVPIDENMPEGNYTLSGYTLFMQNQGAEYMFRKNIPIKSRLSKKYELETIFDNNILRTSLKNRVSSRDVKANNISLIYKNGDGVDGIHGVSSKNFRINKTQRDVGVVKIKYDKYEKFVNIPPGGSFSISFYPEGGYLVPGVENVVGFKCVDGKGYGRNVKGVVRDSPGDSVVSFYSTHLGMGKFKFIPEKNKTYTAIVEDEEFKLPRVNDCARIISIKEAGIDSVLIRVLGKPLNNAVLFAHNCGIPKYATYIRESVKKISKNELGEGIVQFMLIDSVGNALSSRLMFNDYGYIYADTISELPKGDYAVSLNNYADYDSKNTSIVSDLLLQSELKGYIENPNYYFDKNEPRRLEDLDNLLLTQGWERYDVPSALKGEYTEPHKEMEIGGVISGLVKSRFRGKPLEGAAVNVISPNIGFVQVAQTDSAGRFIINGIDWPDGTVFAVRAFNKKGNAEHNFELDKDINVLTEPLIQDYISCFVEDGDYRTANDAIWLEELEVLAKPSDEELQRNMQKALGIRIISDEDIEKKNITSYTEVIEKMPGLRMENGNIVRSLSKGNLNNPNSGIVEIWIDGTRWQGGSTSGSDVIGSFNRNLTSGNVGGKVMPKSLNSYAVHTSNTFAEFESAYPIEVIKEIKYYKPSLALVISSTAAHNAGALVMTTKDGSSLKSRRDDIFVQCIMPKGYQKPVETYQSPYCFTPSDDDISDTWYPELNEINLFSQIKKKNILIQGITDSGIPVFVKVERKE